MCSMPQRKKKFEWKNYSPEGHWEYIEQQIFERFSFLVTSLLCNYSTFGIFPLLLKNNLFFSNFVIRWLLHHFHISISCEETWISIKYGSDLITPKIFHVVTVKMKMWWKKGITIYWKVWNICAYLFVVFSKKGLKKF